MNSECFANKDSSNLVDTETQSRAKPVLFLHIPKTGGSSFLTALGNVFGERRVRRLRRAEEMTQTQIDHLVSDEIQDIDCLVGHFPIHLFANCLDTFRPFTILRDPVDRVMSLFRFLKRAPQSETERLELREGFGFDDFIESRVAENYAQTRNLMCRMLCGDAEMSDPSSDAFWEPRDPGALVDQALSTLRAIDFGLVEDMQSTLALAQHAWATRFNLDEYRTNASDTPGAEWTAHNIQRIVDLNALDVALYHEARALFYARVRNVSALGRRSANGIPSLPVLRVQPGQEVSVDDIPGRRGFHEFEPRGGFAWLAASQTVLIGFLAPQKMLRLRMTLYCVTDSFPAQDIEVTLNGTRLTHRVAPIEGNWVSLETEAFRPTKKLNILTLSPPYAIPIRCLHPKSKDDRYLSVALEKLVFLEKDQQSEIRQLAAKLQQAQSEIRQLAAKLQQHQSETEANAARHEKERADYQNEIRQLAAKLQQRQSEIEKAYQVLAESEARGNELRNRLREQLQATRKLLQLMDNVDDAAARLRSSRRWKIANPVAALKAKLSPARGSLGYGYLEKIVSAYQKWRTTRPEVGAIDD